MSDLLKRPEINHRPQEIVSGDVVETDVGALEQDLEVASRLLQHLQVIQEYKDRVDAVDYLADNAEKLAKGISFDTENKDIIAGIKQLGFDGKTVTFEMFKVAIADVIEGYEQLALVSMTGALE